MKQPDSLVVINGQELILTPLEPVKWLVMGLIPGVGLIVLAGAPKGGKSFLMILLCFCISTGQDFLGFPTSEANVLYLSLEDTVPRIQRRLFQIANAPCPRLHFATAARRIREGLSEQIREAVARYDIELVVIDTLQMVRGAAGDNLYASDYADIGEIKHLADELGICIIVVTHTHKASDQGNVFASITGTNGITGAADEMMVLARPNALDGRATLSVTGRDVELAEYKLRLEDCKWELVERTSREELEEREVPSSVVSVADFMTTRAGNWEGTATELIEEAGLVGAKANMMAKLLNEHSEFLAERGLRYGYRRTSTARLISLTKVDPDGGDGK